MLVLHGFTGSGAAMSPLTERLSGHRVVAVDLIGHGSSSLLMSSTDCTMEAAVDDLDHIVNRLGLSRVHVIGYSMGGRVALSYGAAFTEKVASMVAIGAGAGIANVEDRASRLETDKALAARIEKTGIDAFVNFWSALPLLRPASDLGVAAAESMRRLRLRNDPVSLAMVVRGLGAGSMPPLHEILPELDIAAMFVSGSEDVAYQAIGASLAESMRDARAVVVEAAGHAVHLDNPDGLAAAVLPFLAAVDMKVAT